MKILTEHAIIILFVLAVIYFVLRAQRHRLQNLVTSRKKSYKIYQKIKFWYFYIDENRNSIDHNQAYLLQSKIDSEFMKTENSRLILNFDKNFKKEIFNTFEIAERSDSAFTDLARIYNENSGSAFDYIIFEKYWWILKSNFHAYLCSSAGDDCDKKSWDDLSIPFTILKIYFEGLKETSDSEKD